MPDYCPACDALQVLEEELDFAKGYVRPLSPFDRRNKRKAKSLSATRVEKTEHVGQVVYHYTCGVCGACVTPGVTHVRNWHKPDHWLPVDVEQVRSDSTRDDRNAYLSAWRKENRDAVRAADRAYKARRKQRSQE